MGHSTSSNRSPVWRDQRFQNYLKRILEATGDITREKGVVVSYNPSAQTYDDIVNRFKRMSEREKNYYR